MSFASLKKNSKANFEKTKQATEEMNAKGFETDPNDWYPGVDKAGNGLAVIRFLPAVSEDDLDFVRYWEHSFQDKSTNRWYIHLSRQTLEPKNFNGNVDPVMDFNKKLWDSVPDSEEAKNHPNRKQATAQGRKINFRTNIYIVEDTVNPENNGKVKKFKFGKWAFDQINGVMFPSDLEKKRGIQSVNPFDMFDGPNFVINIFSTMKNGKMTRDYSRSAFEKQTGPLASEKEMQKIYESISEWSLKAYVSPDKFESYEELKKRLDKVVGFDTALWQAGKAGGAIETPVAEKTYKAAETKPIKADPEPDPVASDSEDFFENLVEDSIPFK